MRWMMSFIAGAKLLMKCIVPPSKVSIANDSIV